MKKELKLILLSILILLVGCSKTKEDVFKDAMNNIGVYSKGLFTYIDSNKNSKISKDEFLNYRIKRDDFFKREMDGYEGVIYEDSVPPEYNRTKEFSKLFKKADRDSDGSIDFKEFKIRFHSYRRRAYEIASTNVKFSVYGSKKQHLSLDEIVSKSKLFKELKHNQYLMDKESINLSYWIKMELSKEMKSGTYKVNLQGLTFDKYSFTKVQEMNSSREFVEFHYDEERDKRLYYFKVDSFSVHMMGYLSQKTEELEALGIIKEPIPYEAPSINYYSNPKIVLLFSGLGIGLIFMAGLYNLAIFYNYRRRELLYYSLLQLGMVVLLYLLINRYSNLLPSLNHFVMEMVGLFIAFFATLFTQAFLETKKHLPKMHIMLNVYLVLILVDAVWYADALLDKYHLYSVFGILFLTAGVLRILQGSKIAWFYLIGWAFLIFATFLMEYHHSSTPFYAFFLGAGMEAIMLAWGLAYKMKRSVK